MPDVKPYGMYSAVLSRADLGVLRAAIPRDGSEASKQALQMLRERSGKDDDAAYVSAAQTLADEIHGKDGEVELDADPCISEGGDGAYVQAWVFVPKDKIDARIELNAQGTED